MNGTNGNEPGYPENALVPYPVIVAATTTAPACSCPTVFRQIFRGEMLLSSTEFQGKLQIFLEPWLHRARWRGRCGHRFLIALLECNLYPSCLHNGTTRKGSARSPERFVQLAAVLLFLAVRR